MYYFIINPKSRSGQGAKLWNEIELILKEKKIDYQSYITTFPGEARKISKQLTRGNDKKTLVILGGDGTLNEVINGICDFENISIGYIPTGSSNDFARSLGISFNPLEALEGILTQSNQISVDIGQITINNHSKKFLVSAGIGFDASICHQADISPLKQILNKLKLGKLIYVLIALQQLYLCRPSRMLITVDGQSYDYDKVYLIAMMNVPYEGGGCMFAPTAKWNDRKLDLCIVEGLSKLKILFLLPTVFFGKHTHFKGIHMLRGKSIAIATKKARVIHTDGESIHPKKVLTASCIGNQVKIIY